MQRPSPELEKALVAQLLDRFPGLDLSGIGDLTDRQIHELYYHKRDEKGQIVLPAAALEPSRPATLESELHNLRQLAVALHLTPDNIANCEAGLRTKFAKENQVG